MERLTCYQDTRHQRHMDDKEEFVLSLPEEARGCDANSDKRERSKHCSVLAWHHEKERGAALDQALDEH